MKLYFVELSGYYKIHIQYLGDMHSAPDFSLIYPGNKEITIPLVQPMILRRIAK